MQTGSGRTAEEEKVMAFDGVLGGKPGPVGIRRKQHLLRFHVDTEEALETKEDWAMAGQRGAQKKKSTAKITLTDLIGAGVVKAPMEIESIYRGVQFKATIQKDGRVRWEGDYYESLSRSAGIAKKSVIGAPRGYEYPPTDGWIFWKFRDLGGGKLRRIDVLRQKYLDRHVG
jgi:hypothetical protein